MKQAEIEQILKAHFAKLGKRGGVKGGKSKSETKRATSAKNLEAARAKRWPKK